MGKKTSNMPFGLVCQNVRHRLHKNISIFWITKYNSKTINCDVVIKTVGCIV
jgi:hypothetical protein